MMHKSIFVSVALTLILAAAQNNNNNNNNDKSCEEDPNEKFVWKVNSKGKEVKKKCSWLTLGDNDVNADKVCNDTEAFEICPISCKDPDCVDLTPCEEEANKEFVFKINNKGKKTKKTCSWLAKKEDGDELDEICGETWDENAGVICPASCLGCNGNSTDTNSTLPPATSCNLEADNIFVFKINKKGKEIEKSCSFLAEKDGGELDEICGETWDNSASEMCPSCCNSTNTNSTLPPATPCDLEADNEFVFKINSKGKETKKTCSWLAKKDSDDLNEICGETWDENASLKCPASCAGCDGDTNSTNTNSTLPPVTPCDLEADKDFVFKINKKGKKVKKSCSWLSEKSTEDLVDICSETWEDNASVMCPNYCADACGGDDSNSTDRALFSGFW